MHTKQKMKRILPALLLVLAISVSTSAFTSSVGAAVECGGVPTSLIQCPDNDGTVEGSGLWSILIMTINVLSAGVAVLALAGIIYGSVLYTSAGGNQEQVKKAMGIITNVVVGIIAYALMFSLLNFLIPGGLFNGGS